MIVIGLIEQENLEETQFIYKMALVANHMRQLGEYARLEK